MKKRLTALLCMMAFIATLVLTGCGGSSEDLANSKYVGTWRAVSVEIAGESGELSENYEITLKPDGTAVYTTDEGTTTGKWKLTKDGFKTSGETKLSFTDDGDDILGKLLGTNLRFKRVDEETGELVGIPNPWSEDETAEAAAEGAGVGYFEVPENGTEYDGGRLDWSTFRHMEELAEAEGCIGAAAITARKGLKQNSEDVSGDYNVYAKEWSLDLDGTTIKCYGQEDGKTMKALWVTDNFSYSIVISGQGDDAATYGLGDNDILSLATDIQ